MSKALDTTLLDFEEQLSTMQRENESNEHREKTDSKKGNDLNQPDSNSNLMGYHNMRRSYYYGGTVFVYALEVLLAIFINDVGVVFQFGAALAGSSV